jgi:2-iminobutanoate/2-iminopropanoate deaminase
VARPTGLKTPVAGSTPSGAYSPGIIAEGRLLYVSGQGPLRDGKVVSGSIESEVTLTLQNLAGVVQAAGATLADIVQCRVYLADIGDFDAMDSKPARTTIGAALADGIKVEIDCVVVLPPSESQSGRAVC